MAGPKVAFRREALEQESASVKRSGPVSHAR